MRGANGGVGRYEMRKMGDGMDESNEIYCPEIIYSSRISHHAYSTCVSLLFLKLYLQHHE